TRLTWTSPGSVVLQSAINVIRFAHVGGHRIELRRRYRVNELPGRTLIVTDIQPAIVSDQNVISVIGIYPDGMMITGSDSRLQGGKLLSTIGRLAEVQSTDINVIRVARVNANLA